MIVKQIQCDSAKAGILYAGYKKDSEFISCSNCYGTPNEVGNQFLEVQRYNSTTADSNKTYHVAIGWHEEDQSKLNGFDKKEIAEGFAKKMGFEDRQWVCYEHNDGNAPHMHFIGNRIGIDGKAVSLSNNYYKHEEFSRQQEKKYALKQVQTKDRTKKQAYTQSLSSHRKEELKFLIDKNIKQSKTFDQFKEKMQTEGIKVYSARGISYMDNDKAKFKGSQLGREYSLQHTKERIENQRKQELSL